MKKYEVVNTKVNMQDKKFELTDVTKKIGDVVLHQIKALKDFSDVTAGDLGGFVENEFNLSQGGDCWVYHNASVYGNAVIFENACVFDSAIVRDEALIFQRASIHDSVIISGRAKIYGDAIIMLHANVSDDACIRGETVISGQASVCGFSDILGRAVITDMASVSGRATILDRARVNDHATVKCVAIVGGDAHVCGFSTVAGDAKVFDAATITGDAKVEQNEDFLFFRNNFSSRRGVTWTRSNDMWNVGCFYGTGSELIGKAKNDNIKKAFFYASYVLLVESLKGADFLSNSVYEHRLRLVEEKLAMCRKMEGGEEC